MFAGPDQINDWGSLDGNQIGNVKTGVYRKIYINM